MRTKQTTEISVNRGPTRLRRWTVYLALLLAFALIASACGGATDSTETTAGDVDAGDTETTTGGDAADTTEATTSESADPIRIGAAVSISGDLAQDGANLRRGFELWLDRVNESGGISIGDERRPVELIIYDDESDSTTAANLADRLITEDNVDFMFGPFSSGLTLAVGAITERHGKVLIMPAGNSDEIYEQGWESAFGMLPVASSTPQSWLDLMLEMDPRPQSIAVITKEEPFALSQGGPLAERAQDEGLEVVLDEIFPPNTQDFSAIVSGLRSEMPDLVALIGHTEDNLRFLRAMRDQQFLPKSVLFTGGSIAEMWETVGEDALYAKGIAFWTPQLNTNGPVFGSASDYADLFVETHPDASPHWINALGAASGVTLQLAIEAAQSTDPADVLEALRSEQFDTFFGPVEFDDIGLNIGTKALTEQIVSPEEVLPIAPTDVAAAEAVYPIPGWNERE